MADRSYLRDLLERHSLTQTRVAAEVGISQAFLSQITSGVRTPALDVAMRLAAVLSRYAGRPVSVEELFGGETARQPLRGRLRSLLRYLVGSGRGR